jgi:hypothetical protein
MMSDGDRDGGSDSPVNDTLAMQEFECRSKFCNPEHYDILSNES